MRVALVAFAFGEYTIRLASELAQSCDVKLWVARNQFEPHADLLQPPAEVVVFDKPRMRHPMRQLGLMRRLYRELRDFGPDVVHVQQGYPWFNLFLPALGGRPLVVTVHDPVPHVGDALGKKSPQFLTDKGFRSAQALVVHSDRMRDVMVSRGFDPSRLHVSTTVARGLPESSSSEPDPAMVLFFGRIWPYKGLEYLIRAEPAISAQVPDVEIVIAGQGEDFERYERLIVNPDRFDIRNEFVSEAERQELFARATVVALPYVDATQSAVIATAVSFGVPAVATTVGGLPEMVEHGVSGLLVPPRDSDALAEAIVAILSDDRLRDRLSSGAREKAEAWSAEAVARRTMAVYEAAVRGAERSGV